MKAGYKASTLPEANKPGSLQQREHVPEVTQRQRHGRTRTLGWWRGTNSRMQQPPPSEPSIRTQTGGAQTGGAQTGAARTGEACPASSWWTPTAPEPESPSPSVRVPLRPSRRRDEPAPVEADPRGQHHLSVRPREVAGQVPQHLMEEGSPSCTTPSRAGLASHR